MSQLVAVVDPAAALRRGLVAALAEGGLAPAQPENLEAWVTQEGERAVVFSLLQPADRKRLQLLRSAHPHLPIVALLDDPDPDAYRSALGAGASTALERSADPEEILAAVTAALAGKCLLPLRVAESLCTAGAGADAPVLTPCQVRWIQALARGKP